MGDEDDRSRAIFDAVLGAPVLATASVGNPGRNRPREASVLQEVSTVEPP
jgi:hypothetical protein